MTSEKDFIFCLMFFFNSKRMENAENPLLSKISLFRK